jgi:rhamnulokinase
MGVEQGKADCSEQSRLKNMTNEGGYEYRFRFLKNIMGLWMIQSVRRELHKRYTFDELCTLAEESNNFVSRVNVDDNRFLSPESMISAIQDFCRETGQPVPVSPGELASVIYHSLAEGYAHTLESIEQLTGRTYSSINIVGGGSNDTYLNQMTADTTGRIVYAGPKEATAIGNIIVQMIEKKDFAGLQEARKTVRNSFTIQTFKPRSVR